MDSPSQSSPELSRFRAIGVLAPLVVLALFLLGFATFIGWPRWPVIDAGERIAYSAILAVALACGATLVHCRWRRLALNLAATLACVVPTLVAMVRPGDLTNATLVLWTAIVCVPAAILASMTQRLRERDGTMLASLVTLGMSLAAGALLLSTGSIKLGQAGFALAAGVAVVIVIGLFVASVARSAGVVTLAFAIVAGLLVSGYVWSELPLYAGLCVWAAPAIAWIVRVSIIARRRAWQRVVIGLLLAAIPAAVAVTIEGVKANRASQADEYGY